MTYSTPELQLVGAAQNLVLNGSAKTLLSINHCDVDGGYEPGTFNENEW